MSNSKPLWIPGTGGMPRIDIQSSSGARAQVYRYGSHLTSWVPTCGKQWIFTSEKARFEKGGAIRGGIPVIFPQFNAFGDGPRHGFARNLDWQEFSVSEDAVTLRLSQSAETAVWPHEFELFLTTRVSAESLLVEMRVVNSGGSPFSFTAALHTYFKLDSFLNACLRGLDGLAYWDNDGSPFSQRRTFTEDSLTFTGAIDRVFFGYSAPLALKDGNSRLKIQQSGFEDIVVWNPGAEAAASMMDMGNNEYQHMLCVEAAQIDNPVTLQAGQEWIASQTLTSETDS